MLYSFRSLMFLFVLFTSCFAFESDLNYLKAFDDSIIYRLAWEKEEILKDETLETISMMTARKEKYFCSLPKMIESKQVNGLQYILLCFVVLYLKWFRSICTSCIVTNHQSKQFYFDIKARQFSFCSLSLSYLKLSFFRVKRRLCIFILSFWSGQESITYE